MPSPPASGAQALTAIDYQRGARGIFIAAIVVMAAMHTANTSWNVNSRMALVFAVVDRGTFAIDGYEGDGDIFPTSDKAAFGGHVYSDKAFGVSLLCVPVYALMQAIASLFAFTWDLQVTIYLLRLVSTSIPAALSLSILWLLMVRVGAMPRRALIAVPLAFFGSMWFGYSSLAMPYAPGIAACLAATYLLCFPPADRLQPGRAGLIGLLCGFALICDFLFGPIAILPIAIVFLRQLRREPRERVPGASGRVAYVRRPPAGTLRGLLVFDLRHAEPAVPVRSVAALPGGNGEGRDGDDQAAAELRVVPHVPSVSRSVLLVAVDPRRAGRMRRRRQASAVCARHLHGWVCGRLRARST